jgi:hypothetical protein
MLESVPVGVVHSASCIMSLSDKENERENHLLLLALADVNDLGKIGVRALRRSIGPDYSFFICSCIFLLIDLVPQDFERARRPSSHPQAFHIDQQPWYVPIHVKTIRGVGIRRDIWLLLRESNPYSWIP